MPTRNLLVFDTYKIFIDERVGSCLVTSCCCSKFRGIAVKRYHFYREPERESMRDCTWVLFPARQQWRRPHLLNNSSSQAAAVANFLSTDALTTLLHPDVGSDTGSDTSNSATVNGRFSY